MMHLSKSILIIAAALQLRSDAARINSPIEDDLEGKRTEATHYIEKPYVRDVSKSIVEANDHSNRQRRENSCAQNERQMIFKFTTDRYGYETSYEWKSNGAVLDYGPKGDLNFEDEKEHTRSYCVKVGQYYKLTMMDENGDGFCCGYGKGTYSIKIGDEIIFDSNKEATFTDVGRTRFQVQAAPSQVPLYQVASTYSASGQQNSIGNNSGCSMVKVNVKAGDNADELSWQIFKNDNAQATSPQMQAFNVVSKEVCLQPGEYKFEMHDSFGDGFGQPNSGYFSVEIDGEEIIKAKHFMDRKEFKIQVNPNYENNMSSRDWDWLNDHNTRRERYHGEFGESYVPLKWSPELARQAKEWATTSLGDCELNDIKHEPHVDEGENLAKNRGSGKMGELYETSNILERWVENERYWGYPANAHLTQALWRSSKYLGCGEATKPFGTRGTCHVQVCRYARAGNCNMKHFNASYGDNWIEPMMESDSKCGPNCAPEGCW